MDLLDALTQDRVQAHQPWWVARARVATLAANPSMQKDSLRRAIDLTDDVAVRTFLMDQYLSLG
jgi:RNA polymerase sigma-70 factor (ECF subfamily)